jgi:hypothetical protein
LVLHFPAEHPDYDFPASNVQPAAPAPTLMPGPQVLRKPSLVLETSRNPLAAIVVAVAFLVVAGIVVTVALLGRGSTGGTAEALPGDESGRELVDDTVPEQDVPIAPEPDPVPTDENSARQMLDDQLATDRGKVEALTEYWVPQLSSKRPGLVVNGTVFDYQAIWSDFAGLATRYPGAMLLWSGDYSSFKLADFWVTIAPQSFGTGELANAWCDSAGLDRDNCYAKRITHTGSYSDSTLLR